jgi:hypothetical protein
MKIKLLFALAALAVIGTSCKKDEESTNSGGGSFAMNGTSYNVILAEISGKTVADIYSRDSVDTESTSRVISLFGEGGVGMTISISKRSGTAVFGAGTYEAVDYSETDSEVTKKDALNAVSIVKPNNDNTAISGGVGSLTINSISDTNIDFTFSLSNTTGVEFVGNYNGSLIGSGN